MVDHLVAVVAVHRALRLVVCSDAYSVVHSVDVLDVNLVACLACLPVVGWVDCWVVKKDDALVCVFLSECWSSAD